MAVKHDLHNVTAICYSDSAPHAAFANLFLFPAFAAAVRSLQDVEF